MYSRDQKLCHILFGLFHVLGWHDFWSSLYHLGSCAFYVSRKGGFLMLPFYCSSEALRSLHNRTRREQKWIPTHTVPGRVWEVVPGSEGPGTLTLLAVLRRLLPAEPNGFPNTPGLLIPADWPGAHRAGQYLPGWSGTHLPVGPVKQLSWSWLWTVGETGASWQTGQVDKLAF